MHRLIFFFPPKTDGGRELLAESYKERFWWCGVMVSEKSDLDFLLNAGSKRGAYLVIQ